MSFVASGRAPLLLDHRTGEQIGVVERAWIGNDRKGRALVRFSKSEPAERVMQEVKDGIRQNTSVGYRVKAMKLTEEDEDGDTYRCTSWQPLEVSIVSIPADPSVGIGRAADDAEVFPFKLERSAPVTTSATAPATPAPAAAPAAILSNEERERASQDAIANERKRIAEISAIGAKFNIADKAQRAIADGISVELFKGLVLEQLGAEAEAGFRRENHIGLSAKETKRYSVARAIYGQAMRMKGEKFEADGFERECHEAVQAKFEQKARGFYVPVEVQDAKIDGKRDLVAGTTTAGGHTVSTDLLASSFIDLLRNRMMVRQMGATVLGGLIGNIAIPKLTAASTAYWVAENAEPTEGQQTFGQVTMNPKTVMAYTDFSRQLLLQSSLDVEALVRSDLSLILAIAIDLAALHGTGASNQPTGLVNQAGIGSVAGGTNGLAPNWDHIVDLETQVANSNADVGMLGYLSNSKVRGKLKRTQKFSSTNGDPIWEVKSSYAPLGEMNSYKAGVTNQVSSTLTKGTSSGVCSAIFFGNWRDLVIGEWGSLDILVNPYIGANAGTVRVHAYQSVDIAVRIAASFAAMLDALTT